MACTFCEKGNLSSICLPILLNEQILIYETIFFFIIAVKTTLHFIFLFLYKKISNNTENSSHYFIQIKTSVG